MSAGVSSVALQARQMARRKHHVEPWEREDTTTAIQNFEQGVLAEVPSLSLGRLSSPTSTSMKLKKG